MKHFFAPLALLALPLFTTAQDLPAPSPLSKVEQRIGLTDIKVEYSRPSAKGRVIFGDLVPYDEIWRTGANKSTRITFSGPVTFGGQPIKAGSYSLFAIPHKDAWEMILNSNPELNGTFDRKEAEDVARLKVDISSVEPVETFTIGFANLAQDQGDLELAWENTRAHVHITADATEQGQVNIKEALAKGDAGFSAYNRAASFLLDRGLDAKQALAYAEKSVSLDKKYWNLFTLAKAHANTGDLAKAAASAKEAIGIAEGEKNAGAVKEYSAKLAEWTKAAGK